MNTLAGQQQLLLQALQTTSGGPQAAMATANLATRVHPPWQRGLMAYQAHGHALAGRSLLAAYPVVAALMGEDSFDALARDFWHHHPPERGDLACWGEALADFTAHNPQLADVPYLPDVARVEWALHRATGAPDALADPASFSMLASTDPDRMTLRLPPGTAVITSDWPVASLVAAHLQGEPSMETVGKRVRTCQAECAVVWRHGLRPRTALCSRAEAALLQALAGGRSLLAALGDALALDVHFDFSPWLHAAVTDGLVLGAKPYTP
jgi:hypothetical protein